MKLVIKGLLIAIILALLGAAYYLYTDYTQYLSRPVHLAGESMSFEIKKGNSIRTVAHKLEQQNILKPAWYFLALAKLNKQEANIKAGEYALTPQMKPVDLLKLFTSGKSVQYKQTIIEGTTFKQLIESIKANPVLVQTLTDEDYEHIMQKLGSDFASPEGAFLADTYYFPKNTTDLDFLKRSHKMLRAYLQEQWQNRSPDPALKTPYKALILASIVEKETGHEAERPMIARVFINRLNKGMMLQTDPSVIYGMGDAYKGNIRKKDLQKDTPYNTYTRTGLPPTPIATPGKAAINAVMHPPQGSALYFVAKGNGTSHFSDTYKKHRKAVIKYQLKGNTSRYKGDQ